MQWSGVCPSVRPSVCLSHRLTAATVPANAGWIVQWPQNGCCCCLTKYFKAPGDLLCETVSHVLIPLGPLNTGHQSNK